VQGRELTQQRLASAVQWADWLGRDLLRLRNESPEILAGELRRAAREDSITWAAIVGPDGRYTAHSDPEKTGQKADTMTRDAIAENGVEIARDPNERQARVLKVLLASASGGAKPEELRVGFAPPPFQWTRSEILLYAGCVLPAVLVVYLGCYRLFRRAVEPLAAIRRRLVHCEDLATDRLASLRLNDSFDQISGSWNRIIDFVGEMQEQLRHAKLNTDKTVAMDGFRSERLTSILMQLPFGVMVVEGRGLVSFANCMAVGMLGGGEPLEGRNINDVFDEPLRMSLLSASNSNKPVTGGAGRWTDHTFKRPHGDVTLRFWSLPSELGGHDHILFIQDVTQSKEAERARDNFLYHVTHELRTPLTNIRAYAETLSQGVIDDEQTVRECYNVIMGETQRLNRLVEDILNVSQLEVGSALLNLGEVPMDVLLRKVVQDMQGNADAKRIDLVLSLPAKAPRVRGDRDRLAIVLVNLIGNAIKYTPDGGRVEIDCVPEHERVRVDVIDTGVGIAPEHQEKIFDKFYRILDERAAGTPGTGLGLSIVRETVRLHGGNVFVNSTPGKGSTFSLVLPALPLDGGATAGARANTSVEKK
jgi:signal transduction histidine kinase